MGPELPSGKFFNLFNHAQFRGCPLNAGTGYADIGRFSALIRQGNGFGNEFLHRQQSARHPVSG